MQKIILKQVGHYWPPQLLIELDKINFDLLLFTDPPKEKLDFIENHSLKDTFYKTTCDEYYIYIEFCYNQLTLKNGKLLDLNDGQYSPNAREYFCHNLRTNKTVIELLENLIKNSNDNYIVNNFTIVEIPNDVAWYITKKYSTDGYRTREIIREIHKKWDPFYRINKEYLEDEELRTNTEDEDLLTRWLRDPSIEKYRGKHVAIHPTRGVIAHADSVKTVIAELQVQGISLDDVALDVVPIGP